MRKITIVLLLLAVLLIATRNEPQAPTTIEPPTPQNHKVEGFHDKFLRLHNKERTSRGMDALEVDTGLCGYAQKHAELMASKNSLFHSNMSDLSDVGGKKSVAENIAWGQASEEEAVESWMWSPGHRWNILGSYKRIGFGMKKNKDGESYWCVVFSN